MVGRRRGRRSSPLEQHLEALLSRDGEDVRVPSDLVTAVCLVGRPPEEAGGSGLDRALVRRLRRMARSPGPGSAVLRVGDVVHHLSSADVEVLVAVADAVVRARERVGPSVTGSGLAPLADGPADDADEELTSNETADLLAVSRPHVVKLARTGVLPFRMVGSHHRFRRSDVEAYRAAECERRGALLASIMPDEYVHGDF